MMRIIMKMIVSQLSNKIWANQKPVIFLGKQKASSSRCGNRNCELEAFCFPVFLFSCFPAFPLEHFSGKPKRFKSPMWKSEL